MAAAPGGRAKRPKKPRVDRRTAWREVTTRLGGRLEEGKRTAGDRAWFEHGPWRSRLDTYAVSTGTVTVVYTRVRAYFLGHRELKVRVRARGFFDRLWSSLGFGRPLPVSRELLQAFVVRGKPEPRVPSLFAVDELVRALLAVPKVELVVERASRRSRKRYGEQTGVVYCQTYGIVTDVDRLAGMVAVVHAALDALHRVGEANHAELPRA
jgi:hypothetical protein